MTLPVVLKDPPAHFNREIFDEICRRIRSGEGLLAICRDMAMHRQRFYEWLELSELPDCPAIMVGLSDNYARACTARADAFQEELIDIADDAAKDIVIDPETGKMTVDWEVVGRAKLRIDTRKWIMGQMKPKKYGKQIIDDGPKEGLTIHGGLPEDGANA